MNSQYLSQGEIEGIGHAVAAVLTMLQGMMLKDACTVLTFCLGNIMLMAEEPDPVEFKAIINDTLDEMYAVYHKQMNDAKPH